ncbi:ATP-binding cassette domain-containing protein [Mucilaginibacter sp. PAMB04274]|uniref:ABC transporter ATP-binding protein n=1 Tax=Mucilaginibacter sp. PAMB04274 TaxID=3138568 RepID=UPI0031F72147
MVELSQLTFGYGKQKLFDNLNLTLKPGHIYGLLGKNGAGKSTLLKNMAGLVFPWSGKCTVKGYNAAKRQPDFLQEVFFVPEEIYMPAVTATQFAESTGHFYPNFNPQQFANFLSEFDVLPDKLLTKLSFGQQKKVMIAFGLATNTALLIMDEPTNGLDIPSKSQFRKIIASALSDEQCVIISTHQVRDLDNLIDTIVVVHNRQIVVNKSLDEIAEKLTFGNIPTTRTDFIYAEEGMLGLNAITPNTDGDYGKVDMEILFNAIISNNKQLTEILK